MPSMSDIVIDLGVKAAQKMLKEPLKKASVYYDTHLKLLADAMKALLKDKEIKAQVDKLSKNAFEIKRSAAELKVVIPKKPEIPKANAKSWGKSTKFKSHKEALNAYVEGCSFIIVSLEDYIKKAEDAKKGIETSLKQFQKAAQDAQQKKGAFAKMQAISNLNAMADVLTIDRATTASINKIIAEKKAQLAFYKKHIGKAQSAAIAAK